MNEVTTRRKAAQSKTPTPSPLSFEAERLQIGQQDVGAHEIALASRPDSQGKPDLLGCLRALEDVEREVGYHCDATISLLWGIQALIEQDFGNHPIITNLIDLARNQMEVLADRVDSAVAGEGAWTTTGRELHDKHQRQAAQA